MKKCNEQVPKQTAISESSIKKNNLYFYKNFYETTCKKLEVSKCKER